jgi:hypothetical protein
MKIALGARIALATSVISLAALVAACGGGSTSSQVPTGTTASTGTPSPHIYVAEVCAPTPVPGGTVTSACPSVLAVFAQPLTPSSTPQATVPSLPFVSGMAFDATRRIFVADNGVAVYAQPLTASSIPQFTIPATKFDGAIGDGGVGPLAFDPAGNLVAVLIELIDEVAVVAPPFSASSTSSTIIQTLVGRSIAMSGTRLYSVPYVAPFGASAAAIGVFDEPFGPGNSSATLAVPLPATPTCVAVDPSGNVAVLLSTGAIALFQPPLTAGSTPFASISVPGPFSPVSIAFDGAGRLLVSSTDAKTGSSIDVYVPPLTSASAPSIVVPIAATEDGFISAGP